MVTQRHIPLAKAPEKIAPLRFQRDLYTRMLKISALMRRPSSLVAICLIVAATSAEAAPITEPQAHAIGVDAYLYFYSLVTMDLTRKQLSNVEPGKGFGGADEHVCECSRLSDRRR